MKGHGGRPLCLGRWAKVFTVLACTLLHGCIGNLKDVREVAAELERRTGQTLSETQPDPMAWPPGVAAVDGLSEDELVALALANNAAFRETLADLGLSRADLVQAGMLPNPTLWMLFPVGVKPLELLLRYPIEAFWLRARRLESAELEVQRIAQRLVQNGLDVIRDVRLASADLALARERLALAGEMAKLASDIADLTRARLSAGDATELEVSNAQVDALAAQEQHIRWQRDADIAGERLRNLAGLGLSRWPERIAASPLPLDIPSDPEPLVKEALATRPDLRAAGLGLESAGERIGLARAEVFTFTVLFASRDTSGQRVSDPGLDIALPLFNQNQGGIAQAQARFEKAALAYNSVRDRIVLEVREATAKLNQADTSRDQWQNRVLPPLSEAVRQAEKAYAAGNVSYLFVLENQRKWLDARLKSITADADLRRARAELERGIGRSLARPPRDSKPSSS
jgi:cobalt-zinc-cadmium efflux system outer membrane protein